MMKKIISKEPVSIPDGHGGVRETIYVEVPALQNDATGEVFLGDDALGMLDHAKAIRMGGYVVDMAIRMQTMTDENHNVASQGEFAYA